MPRRPSIIVLAVGSAGIAAHALVVPPRWYEISYDAVEVFALLAMLWGIRRHRPSPASPWRVLAAGLALLVAGDVVYNALTRINGHEVFPSVADGLYVISYPVLAWGLIAILRARRPKRDRTALIDAALVTVVAVTATWVYLVDPSAYGDIPLFEASVTAAYPIGDLLLLAFLARLLVASSRRQPSERLLTVGIGLLLVADVVYARMVLTSSYSVGTWLDATYQFSYLFVALAAVHPTMRAVAEREPDSSPAARSRLWLLAAISLVLPTFAVVEAVAGDAGHAITLAAASAAAFFLLTFRTGVLNASLAGALVREKESLERERILRGLGMALVAAADRDAIGAVAVDHVRRLAGDGSEVLLMLGSDPLFCLTATPVLEPLVGTMIDGFPAPVLAVLRSGSSAMVAAPWGRDLRAYLSGPSVEAPLFVVPLVADERLAGAIVVASPAVHGDAARLLAACEALGAAVSLAIETAELADRLVDERSEQRFGAMIRHSSDLLLVLRPDGTLRFISPSVSRVLGWDPSEVLGRPIAALVHPDEAARVQAGFQLALTSTDGYGPIECRVRHKDGSWRHLEAIGTSLLDDPALAGIVVNVRDVTDRVRLERELTHQALHDPLTGLANRALFLDRVEHALQSATRAGSKADILFLDLDDFKTVNDSLGHPAGDAVLLAVTDRLNGCLRASDTAARLGGDEFAVLLDKGEDWPVVAERIVEALRHPVTVNGHEVSVRASVGVASGDATTAAADLLRSADLAMYVAKSEGKDRCVAFRPEMMTQFLDELDLERALRAAVANGEIDVHYQPIVELATGRVTGAEALVRWWHPVRQQILPTEFIPIAERTELIEVIGRLVLDRACRLAVRVGRHDPAAAFHVAVNISARQVRSGSLVDDVAAVLAATGLSPAKLVIEITESMLLDDLEATVDVLDALRALGVRVAIDDFGTGYSSLSYLGRLPVDLLKIDQSFTKGLGRGDDRNLVPAIVELAHTLRLKTVAEGVETAEQAVLLAGLGCELAQGFHFSPPVSADDFEAILAKAGGPPAYAPLRTGPLSLTPPAFSQGTPSQL